MHLNNITPDMLREVGSVCSDFGTDAHIAVVDGKFPLAEEKPFLEDLLPTAELYIGGQDAMKQSDKSQVLRRTMAGFHAKIGYLLGPQAERTCFNFLLEKNGPWLSGLTPEDREVASSMLPTMRPFNEVNQSSLTVLTLTSFAKRVSIAAHFGKQQKEKHILARWNAIMERYKAAFR